MRVVRLKKGTHWTVCALCDPSDPESCQVLEFLSNLEDEARQEVLADLKSTIPDQPQKVWGFIELSKPLGDGWFEFRWNGKLGARRILYFFEPGRIVICGHGVVKKKQKIPTKEMEAANERLRAYRKAKESGKVKFELEEDLLDDLE